MRYFAFDITKYFNMESITVTIIRKDMVNKFNLYLDHDRLVGIIFGLIGMKYYPEITSKTLITLSISINDILDQWIYDIKLKDKLSRPYSVDIINANGLFQTVYFTNIELVQGLSFVAKWYDLPDNGLDYLWNNLTKGSIPITF